MSPPTLALYRGRFDPPGNHHLAVIHALLRRFDGVVVVPWGAIDHRAVDENVSPVYRARLIDLAFGRLERVTVDLRDLEHLSQTSAAELEAELVGEGNLVSHVVEADVALVEKSRLPKDARIVVVASVDAAIADIGAADVVHIENDVSGRVMRKRAFEGELSDDVVPPAVASDIRRRGLYRSIEPRSHTMLRLADASKVFAVFDDRNPRAHILRERLKAFLTDDINAASAIVVIGGDGSMLHAIQTHWRRRLPFIGVNAGHLGFLLNDARTALPDLEGTDGAQPGAVVDDAPAKLLSSEFICHHLPMLHVELQRKDGTWISGLTFNDAWIERASGQSAWLEISVDGQVRLEKLVCDGVLVSTAAGSTAYARSMGASPLLADTPAWLLVGSNVMDPVQWKSALLAKDAVVEARSLHVDKRPLVGYLHGISMGEVVQMRARLSRAASVELCFLGKNDLTEKIARVQFITAR